MKFSAIFVFALTLAVQDGRAFTPSRNLPPRQKMRSRFSTATPVDWDKLAQEWTQMNRDDLSVNDSGTKPVSALTVPNQGSTTVPDWQKLAKEWAERNRDDDLVKQFKGTEPTASRSAPAGKVEVSWDQMMEDIEKIRQEAQETFEALKQIEAEILQMIDGVRVRNNQYQETIRQSQSNLDTSRREMTGKLDALTDEYNKFRSDAQLQQQATQQESIAVQQRLQGEIEDFRQKLNHQIQTAAQEAERAQDFMKKRLELEQELADFQAESSKKMQYLKSGYEHELGMRSKELESTQQNLRWLQEDGQRRLDQAIKEGQEKLDREWIDYTYSLIEKTNELYNIHNELDAATSRIQQQDQQIEQLQSENAETISLAQGTWDLINKIQRIGIQGDVATSVGGGEIPSLADIKMMVADMINALQAKDGQYRAKIQELENDLKTKEIECSSRLESLADEFQKYKVDTHNQQTAAMKSMKDTQEDLKLQIEYIQTKLQEQEKMTKKQAARAEDFLRKRIDAERELSFTTRDYNAEIDELDRKIKDEQDGRAEDRRAAVEAFQEQVKFGRKLARQEQMKGLEQVKKVKEELKQERFRTAQKSKERRKVLAILAAATVASVVVIPKIQEFDLKVARPQLSSEAERSELVSETAPMSSTEKIEYAPVTAVEKSEPTPKAMVDKSESVSKVLTEKTETAPAPELAPEKSETSSKPVAEKSKPAASGQTAEKKESDSKPKFIFKSLIPKKETAPEPTKTEGDSKGASKSAAVDVPWGQYGAEWFEKNS